MNTNHYLLKHRHASIWISSDNDAKLDYCYGGTRTIRHDLPEEAAAATADRLMFYESGLKNCLINGVLQDEIFENMQSQIPDGLIGSKVGGARCVIRPRDGEVAAILSNPAHPDFQETVSSILATIGTFLNDLGGKIKLTPDFGRFSGLADILHRFTPNVLGIKCESGGCGGKSSYTSTGIAQAVKSLGLEGRSDMPVTLIGAAGACGSGVLNYLLGGGFNDVAVCDLVYDDDTGDAAPKENTLLLPSEFGRFTDACLCRGGLIIATTIGNELINSNWKLIPRGSVLLLAHNDALPAGEKGAKLVDEIQSREILVLPGQILTFGGALTSRVEWFWRQSRPGAPMDKKLAHAIVSAATDYWIQKISNGLDKGNANPYRSILERFAEDRARLNGTLH